MHILLCMPSLAVGKGGAERVAAELGFAMTARGHEVSYAYKVSHLTPTGMPQYPVPEESWLLTWENRLQEKLTFRKKVCALAPDLILIFYAGWQVMEPYSLLHDLNIPLCFQECSNSQRILHENWANASNAYQMRNEILSESVGIRVTQNEYAKSFGDDLQEVVHSFPNAFSRSTNNANELALHKTILHIGGAKQNKQVSFMLDAFSKIHNQFPDWKLVLCSTIPTDRRNSYEEMAKKIQNQLPGRVILKENVDDMDSIYKKTGIHCITSLSEGLPNCVCEAMCHGIPSVGYEDSIGTNLLITHGINGILASAAPRVESLAAALSSLMSDEGLQRKLGTRAWEQSAAFCPDTVYDAWENLFKTSLARAATRKIKKETLSKRICTNYDDIREQSWREYIDKRIASLVNENVIFFGCGNIYNDFKYLFSNIKPKYIIVDKTSGINSLDGIDIIELHNFHDNLLNYKIVIFSESAMVIEHRLKANYGLTLDILCIDSRMYAKETVHLKPFLQKKYLLERIKKVEHNEISYPIRHVNNTSCVNNEIPNCAFCGGDKFIPYLSSNNVPWYGGETFQLLRCANCNLVCASPRPAEEYVIKTLNSQGEYFFNRKLHRKSVQSIHDKLAQRLFSLVPHATTAFDVGFGAGTMLHAYRKLGLTAEGNEINSYSCNKLAEQGFTVYNSTTTKLSVNKKYDIITVLDYIEHTYNPFDDLIKINTMLNDNGILFLKTLYLGSKEHILSGEKWKLFGMGHFYYYFIDILMIMIEHAGFTIIDVKTTNIVHILAQKTPVKNTAKVGLS